MFPLGLIFAPYALLGVQGNLSIGSKLTIRKLYHMMFYSEQYCVIEQMFNNVETIALHMTSSPPIQSR